MTRFVLTVASSILLAQGALGATLNLNGNECPKGWSFSQGNNNDAKTYCCYGSVSIINNDGFCCVHSSIIRSGADSGGDIVGGNPNDACFPFCTKTDGDNDKRAFPSQQCLEKIPFSASDYSQRVSAASKSAQAMETGGSKPSDNDATTTQADSTDATTTAEAGSGSGDGGSKPTGTKNAAPAITHGAVQVGGVVAAAVMMAL